MLGSTRRPNPREETPVPSVPSLERQRCPSRRPGTRLCPPWALALLGAALALGGCLQDAQNADKKFVYDNPSDPTTTGSASAIAIVAVDYLSSVQTAVIVNSSGSDQDMNGWALLNQTTTNKYSFASFALVKGAFVRVHPGAGTNSGTDLYTGAPGSTSPTWAINQVAVLQNAGGGNVASCTVGSPTC